MAQSGIEAGDQWSFLDPRPQKDAGVDMGSVTSLHSDLSPVTSLSSDFSPVTSLSSDLGPVTSLNSDLSPVTSLSSDLSPVTSLGSTAEFSQLTRLHPSDDERLEDELHGRIEEDEDMKNGTGEH